MIPDFWKGAPGWLTAFVILLIVLLGWIRYPLYTALAVIATVVLVWLLRRYG